MSKPNSPCSLHRCKRRRQGVLLIRRTMLPSCGFHGYNIHLNANGIQWSAHSGPEYSTAMKLAEV